MDRHRAGEHVTIARVPRARGDGPPCWLCSGLSDLCSPRTRGWTGDHRRDRLRHQVFPAHAGMDQPMRHASIGRPACSPRTRGWTEWDLSAVVSCVVFPAHAGMDRRPSRPECRARRVPRARGDGPRSCMNCRCANECSPRTRGWTASRQPLPYAAVVFPAHAGMDRGPRLRPDAVLRVPRARGDGPLSAADLDYLDTCSPRTRGWTVDGTPLVRLDARVPRARGDGPNNSGQNMNNDGVFPAHAGMDRTAPATGICRTGVPRARGDGPGGKK